MHGKGHLSLVLCWHMHQPQYQGLVDGIYREPWVYLHAIKDYADMAAHLEAIPEARAVVNFSPLLLDQIADYILQIRTFLNTGAPLRDPLLASLVGQGSNGTLERSALIASCLRANKNRVIDRFPYYRSLVLMAESAVQNPELLAYFNDRYLMDLAVWYHLVWLGESVRRKDSRIDEFMKQEHGFSEKCGRVLVTLIAEILEGLVPRYKALALGGRVELSFTPYAHPIVPLLLDFAVARESQPAVILPGLAPYPGGEERARRQIQDGKRGFERHFGFAPEGCWPSEGAISEQTLALLQEAGLRWTASGERVLRHTMEAGGASSWQGEKRHRAYRRKDETLSCFFRDDGLSDLIGFSYAQWHADDAVGNLIEHLEEIAVSQDEGAVVSIIMDGENAWEYYPENGHFFLQALYRRLGRHPHIHLTTFSEYLRESCAHLSLPHVVAGSWVNGTLATWIGDPQKNEAWDVLVRAKCVFDEAVASGSLSEETQEKAEQILAICEGSDWFWWFGDYNPPDAVARFERLYHRHITDLYTVLDQTPPLLRAGGGRQRQTGETSYSGGVMRPSDSV